MCEASKKQTANNEGFSFIDSTASANTEPQQGERRVRFDFALVEFYSCTEFTYSTRSDIVHVTPAFHQIKPAPL